MSHTTTRRSAGKIIAGVTLSLAIAFSGSALISPKQVEAASASSSSKASRVISIGKKYLGAPYVFGAKTGNTSSFDCSSFTQYVYRQVGVSIPRSSKNQSTAGRFVSRSNLKAGDLIFSDTNRDGKINHVSIYMGNGKLLHTYRKGIGVTISNFKGSAWDKTYVTARRVL
ncbi:C40 family peptidase [Paenibacillus pinihumi]|uniref:C40 family peptidase n=1 Tax=Paenibacillus pinihumi TaxID=669462 RepID=UPI000405395D|nr:C40 family peptidase [Paenibacillus pinihumi]